MDELRHLSRIHTNLVDVKVFPERFLDFRAKLFYEFRLIMILHNSTYCERRLMNTFSFSITLARQKSILFCI